MSHECDRHAALAHLSIGLSCKTSGFADERPRRSEYVNEIDKLLEITIAQHILMSNMSIQLTS